MKNKSVNCFIKTCTSVLILAISLSTESNAQPKSVTWGITASLNYGFPQIEATATDQLGFTAPYNSLYSAGFGSSLGGVVIVPFGKKTGLRTGLGAEWRNYRYGGSAEPKEYSHNFILVNLPALFQLKPTRGFTIEIGPEFNMAVAQNLEQSQIALVEPDIFKPEVLANLGIQFRLAGNSYLGLNARWGLTALGTFSGTFGQSNEYTTDDMRFLHRGVSLSYYYLFD